MVTVTEQMLTYILDYVLSDRTVFIVLGEVEVLMEMDTYMTTAVCTERTEVLVLEMRHYERLFVKKHQRTIDTMRRNLEKKLVTRTSVLKEYDVVPLLKLLQMKLHLLHNPPPAADDNKKKRPETSVQIAEKLFFNHQGPLLDIEGPGSVFYMIRARQRSKLRLQAYKKEKNNARQKQQNDHVHSIRIPHTLIMAANMAGAAESGGDNSDLEIEPVTVVAFTNLNEQNLEIDTVAHQNVPNDVSEDSETFQATISDRGMRAECVGSSPVTHLSGISSEHLPKAFSRIHSAANVGDSSRSTNVLQQHIDLDSACNVKPRHVTRFERRRPETNLNHLELKVAEWLMKDNPKDMPNVSKLRRLQVQVSDVCRYRRVTSACTGE